MGTCIPTHALLSGLVRRIRDEGAVPARSDVESLLKLGIGEAEMREAFAAVGGAAGEAAIEVLAQVTGR